MNSILFRLICAALVILTACAGPVHRNTGDKADRDNPPVYEETLSNGLKVIALVDKSTPMSIFEVWYNAGAINEVKGKTGLSHLLEHMMFKGTSKHGPNTFSKIIKRAGGIDNAGTSRDYAYYFQKLAPDRLNLSIELEADRMQNLLINPDDVLSERAVVMEERRMRYEDDPQNLVYEKVMAEVFKTHPYGRPVIGWMNDIKGLTADDLRDYYETWYAPNNAFIVVAGNIDLNAVLKQIREEFGTIPEGRHMPVPSFVEPEQKEERRVYVRKEAELPYVFIAYKAPNILKKDSFALDVLVSILSDGKSSRIYKNLVDRQRVALSAGAGFSNIQKFDDTFYFYGTAMPGRTIDEVEEALYKEVDEIIKTPPSATEMEKARNQVQADFIMSQDSLYMQAMMLGRFEMAGDWRMNYQYVDGIAEVTAEDVQRVAGTYLLKNRRTVGILVPEKRKREDDNK